MIFLKKIFKTHYPDDKIWKIRFERMDEKSFTISQFILIHFLQLKAQFLH
jgi:hypothetical protein